MEHGSLNVSIEHHPTIRYMVYNGCYKVMSNIPKMGQLPTSMECACKKKTPAPKVPERVQLVLSGESMHRSMLLIVPATAGIFFATALSASQHERVLYTGLMCYIVAKMMYAKQWRKKNTEVFSFCLLYTYPVLYVNMYIYIKVD